MSNGPVRDRYAAVFALLVVGFVLGATVGGGPARLALLALDAGILLMVLRLSRTSRPERRAVRIGLGIGSVIITALAVALPSRGTEAALLLWLALVLLGSIVATVDEVLRHQEVRLQTIFGALSAYLLIGFFFASVYGAVARIGPDPFFTGGADPDGPTLQYFSFVTLTTTGYGDLTPAGGAGRALAVLEALFGQIFLVTLVARLVAVFGQIRPPRERGRPPRDGGPASG